MKTFISYELFFVIPEDSENAILQESESFVAEDDTSAIKIATNLFVQKKYQFEDEYIVAWLYRNHHVVHEWQF